MNIAGFGNLFACYGPMYRISDGIEWRSEQQELFLWLFQQAGARGGPVVFTARRPGDGEDFVSHGAWMDVP